MIGALGHSIVPGVIVAASVMRWAKWLVLALLVLVVAGAVSWWHTGFSANAAAGANSWIAPRLLTVDSVHQTGVKPSEAAAGQAASQVKAPAASAVKPSQARGASAPASAAASSVVPRLADVAQLRVFAFGDAVAAAAAPAIAKPLTDPDWSVAAVATIDKESMVVIRFSDGQTKTLKVNDKLPGGAVIKRIEADRLYLILEGERRVLRTYRE